MVNFIKILIFLLIDTIINDINILKIPFKKEIPDLNHISSKEIIENKLLNNLILTELRVGTPPQTIKLRMEFSSNLFYIADYYSLSHIKFYPSKSETYKKISDNNLYPGISKLNQGVLSLDYFYFNKSSNDKYNTTFILGEDTDKDDSGGLLGLNLDDPNKQFYNKYSFINEIKKLGLISNYYFTIKYTNDFSGNIIFGELPHKYDKRYKEKNYKEKYVDIPIDNIIWNFQFDKIYSVNNVNTSIIRILDERINGNFRIESNVIEGSETFRQYLLASFMKENINEKKCFQEKSKLYYTFYCTENTDITKINNLYFYNKELNYTFELTYKELFYHNQNDGNYYFLVVFKDYSEEDYPIYSWVLGEPLFKKYEIYFNKDSKRIGIYYKNIDESEGEDDNEEENKYSDVNEESKDNQEEIGNKDKKSWWSKNKWYAILIIALILFFFGFGITLFLYLKNKPKRKAKANELNDDYEYQSVDAKNNLINYKIN